MARKPKGNHRVYKEWAASVNLYSTKYESLIEKGKDVFDSLIDALSQEWLIQARALTKHHFGYLLAPLCNFLLIDFPRELVFCY